MSAGNNDFAIRRNDSSFYIPLQLLQRSQNSIYAAYDFGNYGSEGACCYTL
jgi:hypothetical protein